MESMIEIYDTTLRDGGQRPGISWSLHDKLVILEKLDKLGVPYVELGWPGSNEKDSLVFQAVKKNPPKNARIVAFGKTCSRGKSPKEDKGIDMVLGAETEHVAIVGKASKYQAERILGVSQKENLRIIQETCRFFVDHGRKVFFDAEHFFDGWELDPAYTLLCLKAAVFGGASRVVLCDTNGGSLPSRVASIVELVKQKVFIPIGMHAHNDGEMAVAISLAAVEKGADQVQVTINGYGERCGNANLCSVVPALRFKMGLTSIPDKGISQLTELARFTSETANLSLDSHQPYVGEEAFCHKGGLHVSAVAKDVNSYQHIDPGLVGNKKSVAVSELSGRSNIVAKAEEFGIALTPRQVERVLAQVEKLENRGFQFEVADGSLKLLMLHEKKDYRRPFEITFNKVDSERFGNRKPKDSAIIKVRINNGRRKTVHCVADGNGPVNAIDRALRKALIPFFPEIKEVQLVDFKVRTVRGERGTSSFVRVIINFSNGVANWDIVGCSTDILEASSEALADGLEYAIVKAL